jgi:hypothetical protein
MASARRNIRVSMREFLSTIKVFLASCRATQQGHQHRSRFYLATRDLRLRGLLLQLRGRIIPTVASQIFHWCRRTNSHLSRQLTQWPTTLQSTMPWIGTAWSPQHTLGSAQPDLLTTLPIFKISRNSISKRVQMPDVPATDGDFSMWSGLNYNMADIFESATWENLVGSTGSIFPGWEGQT